MNTQLTFASGHKSTDNLIILSDKNQLDGVFSLLSENEAQLLRKAAQKNLPHLTLLREDSLVLVHFLHSNNDTNQQLEDIRIAGNEALSIINHHKLGNVYIIDKSNINAALPYAEGMMLGNYKFLKYFSKKEDKEASLQLISIDSASATASAVEELAHLVAAVCYSRDMVNEPQSYLTVPTFMEHIKEAGTKCGFTVSIIEKAQLESMKMGGLLAVNKGSLHPPAFAILEWKPSNATNTQPIVLVGKGVVYDTGGLSLKSTPNGMDMMKSDMGGAATVLGAMMAVASNRLPIHVISLIPATDNRPAYDAYAPGDVITMYSGTTVEVLDTDAEGRLILADALHYAKQYEPSLVIDFATLTGAAQRISGQFAAISMGNANTDVKEQLQESGFRTHERLMELPLWKEYGKLLKSNIADLKNVGGPYAGAITAGKFLEHFTTYPWMHIDIAGPAYIKAADTYRSKEGTGFGVRLMYDFLKRQ